MFEAVFDVIVEVVKIALEAFLTINIVDIPLVEYASKLIELAAALFLLGRKGWLKWREKKAFERAKHVRKPRHMR